MKDALTNEQLRIWESLDISNAFIFYRVMRNNPDICLKLLQRILPELDIKSIRFLDVEKYVKESFDSKGVRMDALAGDESDSVYNIEMQVRNEDNLPRRSRYNQSMTDNELLDSGEMYEDLPDSYTIFICKFDLFGAGFYKYTFKNMCIENRDICLGDGTCKLFLNPYGENGDVSTELKAFLDLLRGIVSKDEFVQELESAVAAVKRNSSERRYFMTWEMEMKVETHHAYKKGVDDGKQQGKTEGIDAMSTLLTKLIAAGRSEDVTKAATDPQALREFAKEFDVELF